MRKARLVGGGHTTNSPASSTYSSVVSKDSVRIAVRIVALNDLDILSYDIQNAYLTAVCRERFGPGRPQDDSQDGALWPQVIESGVQRKVSRGAT